jgi:hypothetical protein
VERDSASEKGEIQDSCNAVRLISDHRGVDLISDALPFGRLWYGEPDAVVYAIEYAKFYSRSHDAVIRVFTMKLAM